MLRLDYISNKHHMPTLIYKEPKTELELEVRESSFAVSCVWWLKLPVHLIAIEVFFFFFKCFLCVHPGMDKIILFKIF